MESFYTQGTYLQNNPTWDLGDTEWKLKKIIPLIHDFLNVKNQLYICEIGCGGAGLLSRLAAQYPQHIFHGWDISPDASKFWHYKEKNLFLKTGDIFKSQQKMQYDLVLLIDVIEHVENPHDFLANVKTITKNCFFHVPLDLSVISIVFDHRLISARRQVGHIHYFTKGIFLELLREVKLKAISICYSNSWKDSPHIRSRTKFINIGRMIISFFSPDLNARILGANTLFAFTQSIQSEE